LPERWTDWSLTWRSRVAREHHRANHYSEPWLSMRAIDGSFGVLGMKWLLGVLAASIFAEIEDTFVIPIPTAALLDAPMIEHLARNIDSLTSRR
jgi:hypothetical protein